jgi:quinol monooxygenase YgiN
LKERLQSGSPGITVGTAKIIRSITKFMKNTLLIAFTITMFAMTQSVAQDKKQVVRIARITIDPAQAEQYKAAVKEIGEASLKLEPGVLMLFSVADKNQRGHITVMEVYADSAAYQAHIQTAHFRKYKAETKNMVRSLDLVEVDPIYAGMKPEARF